MKLIVYVLFSMVVTFPTCQLLRSLLNTDAPENAVQIFKNNNTKKEKKRHKNKYQRKKKIGNNILVWYSLQYTKMENYKEQYTNNKRRQRIEIEYLRTIFQVDYIGHRPLRNITIERWCLIKRCSNHSRTIIQQRKNKSQRTNTKKEEENWK